MFKRKTVVEKKGYDPELLAAIQTQGNLLLNNEQYIKFGSGGYALCLEVYGFPSLVSEFWLSTIMSNHGVIAVLDIATANNDEGKVSTDLNKSMAELGDQVEHMTSQMEQKEALHEYGLLNELADDITAAGEVVKLVRCHLFVPGDTRQQVDEKAARLMKELNARKYENASYLNEVEYQYRAVFTPYGKQKALLPKREGMPMSSETLAAGYFLNHECLDDPHGMYLGTTSTGGNVIFDLFHKDRSRASYDALILGKKGSGKSTLLKKLMKCNAIIGNYIRVIDVAGEFRDLAEMLGGKVITMDGKDGVINYLEVFKRDESEAVSFAAHLSKLNSLYQFLSPSAGDDDRNEFEGLVRKLYEEKGLWGGSCTATRITGLPPEAYPTFSELLALVRRELYHDDGSVRTSLSDARRHRLESIELTIDNLVQSYGTMFDGATTIPDLTKEQVIVFDCQNINTIKSEIFNRMLWNILSIMLNDMVNIGIPGKRAYEAGTPIEDIPKLMLIVDEAHKIINTRNPLALDHMIEIEREGRKYFTGLTFASQSVRDFAPENTSSENIEKLKVLFELTQYKFIMQQDPNCLHLCRRIFDGELTEYQMQDIPRFERGECILDITGSQSLIMSVEVTDEELDLFKGGA